jgi:hypothetical protein
MAPVHGADPALALERRPPAGLVLRGRDGIGMLLIDAANVIGARPTGWWRDRPGAARELVARVRAATADGRLEPPVVIVLEGSGRRGATEGYADGVEVVHAAGVGDDALVQVAGEAGESVLLVSADRELRRRAGAIGADVVGPNWLLDQLDS